jgi:Synergist-CTERM protein sorting domain-containing protein
LGSTAFLTGQSGQLVGEGTGATFKIPLDRPREGIGGLTGLEQFLGLTAEILGEETYNDIVAFLKEENENSPDKFMDFGPVYGKWYLPYTAKAFFDHFGLAVMGKFSDDYAADIGDDFQLGVIYDEEQFAGGTVSIMYGTMIMDSSPKDGAYWKEITPEGYPVKVSLLYDGKSDDEIKFSYWLAQKPESSGCNAGFGTAGLALSIALGAILRKRHH